MCLSTHLQIIGHEIIRFAVYSNNAEWSAWTLSYFASTYRKEYSLRRIIIHPEATGLEITENCRHFAVGRKVFDGEWESMV
jgi:hypothetical protein